MISLPQKLLNYFKSILSIICLTGLLPANAQTPYVEVKALAPESLSENYFGQNGCNIIYGRSLNDPALRKYINQIQPGTIRHVASSPANWWDWRTGWFLNQKDILPGYRIRNDWAVLPVQPDKISDLKLMVDTVSSKVIFVPNVLTSRLDFQVASLFEFAYQNLQTPYAELGCEFYLDNNELFDRFPSSIVYADTASKWAAGFKQLFPNLKIAMIGATAQGSTGRRNTWTENVIAHAYSYDAISLHAYITSGLQLNDSIIPKSKLPQFFSKPFDIMNPDDEVGGQLAQCPPGIETWISEYNLTERNYVIHGLWAHGLFTAAMTMAFLSDHRITHVNQFMLSGDAYHGDVFETDNGFASGPGYKVFDRNLITKKNEFTAVGNAMAIIGRSLTQATSTAPLVFVPKNGAQIDSLTDGRLSFCGYKVYKPYASEVIMLNLSDDSTQLDFSPILGTGNLNYEILWWHSDLQRRPLIEVTGNMPLDTGSFTGGKIYVPPYSILRVIQKENKIEAIATDDTICEGTSTSLAAFGGTQYSWSPAVITQGDGAIAYVSPAVTTTYTATATEGCTGPECIASVTVVVKTRPTQGTIIVSPASTICPDQEVTLTVAQTDANKFCWTSPVVGSQFAQQSITVKVKDTTTFYLFGAKDGCYSYRDSVTISVRPSANAGIDEVGCMGDSITIGTPGQSGLTYSWSPSNGLNNSAIAQPEAAPLQETTYTLKVTDVTNGCYDYDTVLVKPVQCCSAPDSVPVFNSNSTASDFLHVMQDQFGASVNWTSRNLSNYEGEIRFNGIFIIDSSLSISNCPKLKFGEDAIIKVSAPNMNFVLRHDSLSPCGPFYWGGIRLTNILANVRIDSCFITAADTVLKTQEDATFQVYASHLYGNHYGIELTDYVGASWENHLITIYGNDFEGDSASVRGIGTYRVYPLTIGDINQAPNIFRHLHEGINSTFSSIEIYNNHFEDLDTAIVTVDTATNAALGDEYTVAIGAGSSSSANIFKQVPVAIKSSNITLTVEQDSFMNCNYGVWAENGNDRIITVSDNYFDSAYRAISLIANRDSKYFINNNAITTQKSSENYYPVAINVSDFSASMEASGLASVGGNIINSHGLYGILVSNTNGTGYKPNKISSPRIAENSIYIYDDHAGEIRPAGIRLENCLHQHITNNFILGKSLTERTGQGIQLFDVSYSQIFCNTIDSLSAGIVFIGNNENDSLWTNSFLTVDTAVKVGQSTSLYGRLADQTGNPMFTPGNLFMNDSMVHLASLDSSEIKYVTGNDEQYPPLNNINFILSSADLPTFSCVNNLPLDTSILSATDSCLTAFPYNDVIQSIIAQYPTNGEQSINQNESALWFVAYQCPLECGSNVFIARALLQTKYDHLVFNDDSICRKPTVDTSGSSADSFYYHIFPNPSSGVVYVEYSFADTLDHDLVLFDLLGREISSYHFFDSHNEVGLYFPHLTAGLYFLTLNRKNERIRTDKLILRTD